MNKNIIIAIVAVIVFIVIWYFVSSFYSTQNNILPQNQENASQNNTQNQTANTQTGAKGTIYFSITDVASAMGSVTAVDLSLDKVEIFSKTKGWVTISQNVQTFSLLDLKAKSIAKLIAKTTVPADTYSQIRIHVIKVSVTALGQVKDAKLPSNELKIIADVRVNGNTNSTARIDILADKSLHKTGKGEYIFSPVIKFDNSSNATVQVNSNNAVIVSGGSVNPTVNAGMDVDGTMKSNFMVDQNSVLQIDNGTIKIIPPPAPPTFGV